MSSSNTSPLTRLIGALPEAAGVPAGGPESLPTSQPPILSRSPILHLTFFLLRALEREAEAGPVLTHHFNLVATTHIGAVAHDGVVDIQVDFKCRAIGQGVYDISELRIGGRHLDEGRTPVLLDVEARIANGGEGARLALAPKLPVIAPVAALT